MPLWLYEWAPKDQEIKKESGAQAFTLLLPVSMSGLFCYIPNLSKRLLSFFLVLKWGGDQSAFLFLSVYLLAVHAQHWPFAILGLSVNVLLGGDGHLTLKIQLLHAFLSIEWQGDMVARTLPLNVCLFSHGQAMACLYVVWCCLSKSIFLLTWRDCMTVYGRRTKVWPNLAYST